MSGDALRGSRLCGAASFAVRGKVEGPGICHCSQCRKQSGHVWASAFAPASRVEITGEVRWFASSDTARRGVCPHCGSFLFWRHTAEDTISFSLGVLDGPTGLTLEKHIFARDKGDYYEIADGLSQST
ncbi:hypothetical protein CLV78_11164 [Aliiruegeria haliotis]|uniref:CENP-V/GFA domain-containing protein n=1 Tax=Aliiruegeria haliotis TaxID=1280846 RepID=A0A2T0RII3_9RHOB|nr:GFA family protein [Aliiruegeria haliotis]PRY20910.1 hypothetical protein CLV78_11164 [Aliiruegeria haliotis]